MEHTLDTFIDIINSNFRKIRFGALNNFLQLFKLISYNNCDLKQLEDYLSTIDQKRFEGEEISDLFKDLDFTKVTFSDNFLQILFNVLRDDNIDDYYIERIKELHKKILKLLPNFTNISHIYIQNCGYGNIFEDMQNAFPTQTFSFVGSNWWDTESIFSNIYAILFKKDNIKIEIIESCEEYNDRMDFAILIQKFFHISDIQRILNMLTENGTLYIVNDVSCLNDKDFARFITDAKLLKTIGLSKKNNKVIFAELSKEPNTAVTYYRIDEQAFEENDFLLYQNLSSSFVESKTLSFEVIKEENYNLRYNYHFLPNKSIIKDLKDQNKNQVMKLKDVVDEVIVKNNSDTSIFGVFDTRVRTIISDSEDNIFAFRKADEDSDIFNIDIDKLKSNVYDRGLFLAGQDDDGEDFYLHFDETQLAGRVNGYVTERTEFVMVEAPIIFLNVEKDNETLKQSLECCYLPHYDQPFAFVGFMALKLKDESKVYYEYLVTHLHSLFVRLQLEIFTGSETELTTDDVLNLDIIVPDLGQQKLAILTFKETLAKEKSLLENIDMLKKQVKESEYDVVGTITHNLSHTFGVLKSQYDTLLLLLKKNHFDFTIFSETTNSTIRDFANRVKTNILNLGKTLQKTQDYLQKNTIELENKSVKEIITSLEAVKLDYLQEPFVIDIAIEGNHIDTQIEWNIESMEEVFRNLIENSKKHAFKDSFENNLIKIIFRILSFKEGSNQKSTTLEILYMDNGKGLPKGFDFKSYIRLGERARESNGTGLGGYYINKMVELHKGTFDYIGTQNGFKACFKMAFPVLNGKK
ncbi:MAG: hypothetical protein EAZ85_03350 [Bacteroidetes bacterium]|nr:MAG: hypothetical protein EAZ85_03350 [Bacteroidota bacterium]